MALDIRGMCPLLQVYDMPASMAFYCDVLGFQVHTVDNPAKAPNHDWVWLQRGDIHLMLNTAYEADDRPPQPDGRRVAAHGDTCFYFGAPDVDAVYAYLQEKGIKSENPKVAWYGMKQLYLRDPDGYNICFQWAVEKQASAG
jgi:catechol 2,3-dioxygenase-like lactoylglutathione lyase family enzyme